MKLGCRGGVISSAAHTIFNFTNSLHSKPNSKAQAKLVAAKKQSETEKRRRARINAQYVTLRTILPSLIKMDKASVLGETISRVKKLKKAAAAKVEAACHSGGREDDECVVPSGADRLSLEYSEFGRGLVMKAMLSCEDRAGLMTEVTRAVRSVKGKVVRADMVTVGGRIKILMWLKGLGCSGKNEELVVLRRALKVTMERPVCGNVNRRLRFLQRDYF
ncbi:hypothetical protein FEM48_Zijuj08G0146400 [Ziziphus jujuba var. spinosa]|uniref:BHLH domain-containing protein n=1 Tax=Ziziphus jujuba var. spinosa TaxID=714518 RepID=A0A978UZP6_ZIZJJ|nr:hypothetical protein FEM48_Zijuj08G0146400 [Ziziphus jujuba var. spinosa]